MLITNEHLHECLDGCLTGMGSRHEAAIWGTNRQGFAKSVLPAIKPENKKAVRRLSLLAQSKGVDIVRDLRNGVIGTVSVSSSSSQYDEYSLRPMIELALERSLYSGIIEGVARTSEKTGETYIEPLLGYTQPVYGDESLVRPVGYLHVWTTAAKNRATVYHTRYYDLDEDTMYEFEGVHARSFKRLDFEQAEVYENVSVPRFVVSDFDNNYKPYGYISKLLPLIKSDWVSQVRSDKADEDTAFPQLVTKEVEVTLDTRGTNEVINVGQGGDAKFIQPGNLAEMHEHHDRKIQRLNTASDSALDISSGSNLSQVAILEFNAPYYSAIQRYARHLSSVFTQLLVDATGNPSDEVIVKPNQQSRISATLDIMGKALRDNLISQKQAILEVANLFDDWDAADVERFIAETELDLELEESLISAANSGV